MENVDKEKEIEKKGMLGISSPSSLKEVNSEPSVNSNKNGNDSNSYYQSIKGKDNSISIKQYCLETFWNNVEIMVNTYRITNRDFDDYYWSMFQTNINILSELYGYPQHYSKRLLIDTLDDEYELIKKENLKKEGELFLSRYYK